MKFLRACLAGFFFMVFAAGGLLIGVVLFPLAGCFTFAGGRCAQGKTPMRGEIAAARRRRMVRAAYRLFVVAARVTGLFRVEMSPECKCRLSALRGSVVVANHISLIDVVILVAFLGDTTAIAKVAASRNPFYSHIVRSVFLVNDNPEQVLDDTGRLLERGVNLIVFPEGTRTPPDAVDRKIRRGAAQIALAANAPLEVVHITCAPPVLGKHQPWYDVGDRTIVYTIQNRGTLVPPPNPISSRHAEAVSITSRLAAILFPIPSSEL